MQALPDFAPYVVQATDRTVQSIFAEIGAALYRGHSPVAPQGRMTTRANAEPLDRYRRLLRLLSDVPQLEFVTCETMCREPCPADRVRCCLRHDLDIDIEAALDMARIEHDLRISSTYFLLHTAAYYGQFVNGTFHRHAAMAKVYREIQALGHEIALHTDPLHLYQNLGIDGAQAVRAEIEWLRSERLRVVGTVSHNSAAAYGIDNCAIFKGRVRRHEGLTGVPPLDPESKAVWFNGKCAPLQQLDEDELGLAYEAADDLLFQSHTPFEIGAIVRNNVWFWSNNCDSGPEGERARKDSELDEDQFRAAMAACDAGTWIVLLVHPMYYGARIAEDVGPRSLVTQLSTHINGELGWETYESGRVQCHVHQRNGALDCVSLIRANKYGMLDYEPRDRAAGNGFQRVWLFGADNCNGAGTALDQQCHILAERSLRARGFDMELLKFAFPGMGLSRLFGWFMRFVGILGKPDIVAIPLCADEVELSAPSQWSLRTGISYRYPLGDYLDVSGDAPTLVAAQPAGGLIRRRAPRAEGRIAGAADAAAHDASVRRYPSRLLEHWVAEIERHGGRVLLLVQSCGEAAGLWSEDVSYEVRLRAHDAFSRMLAGLDILGTRHLADPYPAMLHYSAAQSTHWMTTSTWNATGHRLVASCLEEELLRMVRDRDDAAAFRSSRVP